MSQTITIDNSNKIRGFFNLFNKIGITDDALKKNFDAFEKKFTTRFSSYAKELSDDLKENVKDIQRFFEQSFQLQMLDLENLLQVSVQDLAEKVTASMELLNEKFDSRFEELVGELRNRIGGENNRLDNLEKANLDLENRLCRSTILLNDILYEVKSTKAKQEDTLNHILVIRKQNECTNEVLQRIDAKVAGSEIERAVESAIKKCFPESIQNIQDLDRIGASATDSVLLQYAQSGNDLEKFKSFMDKTQQVADQMDDFLSILRNNYQSIFTHGADCPCCHSARTRVYECKICGFDAEDSKYDKEYLTKNEYSDGNAVKILLREVKGTRNGYLLIIYSKDQGGVDLTFSSTMVSDFLSKHGIGCEKITRLLFRNSINKIISRELGGIDGPLSIFHFFPNLRYVSFEKKENSEPHFILGENLFSEACGKDYRRLSFYGLENVKEIKDNCFRSKCNLDDNGMISDFIHKTKISKTVYWGRKGKIWSN